MRAGRVERIFSSGKYQLTVELLKNRPSTPEYGTLELATTNHDGSNNLIKFNKQGFWVEIIIPFDNVRFGKFFLRNKVGFGAELQTN